MDALRDLELLIHSRCPLIAIESFEEERVEEALKRLAIDMHIPLMIWSATGGLQRVGSERSMQDTQDVAKALSYLATLQTERLCFFKDLHRHLSDGKVIRRLQEIAQLYSRDRRALVFSAPHITIPIELSKLVSRLAFALPNESELTTVVRDVVRDLSKQHRIAVELPAEDLRQLAERLKGLTLFEAQRVVTKSILQDMSLDRRDLKHVVEFKRELLQEEGTLEYVRLDDGMAEVGGLENLKAWLRKRRNAFTPEAKRFGLEPPKGIILLGIQGCGKSVAARAVAKDWALPLLKLEPGRLYEKYVGESEKNLERALAVCERMAPCILLLDEIEKGFAYADADADAGLSRRVFGRLLGWLQERKAPVFVVATCNDISQLPPEMTRKGRFDEIFFIDLPRGDEREEILAMHLRARERDPAAFDLTGLAGASEGYSGAEIEQAIVAALYTAFSLETNLDTALILDELAATRPLSVTRGEEIAALRQWARSRTVMAS